MLALLQPVWRVASFGACAALLAPFQILAYAADPEIAVCGNRQFPEPRIPAFVETPPASIAEAGTLPAATGSEPT
jgi:hypothetical protein